MRISNHGILKPEINVKTEKNVFGILQKNIVLEKRFHQYHLLSLMNTSDLNLLDILWIVLGFQNSYTPDREHS